MKSRIGFAIHYSTKVLAIIMNFKKFLLSACITFLNSQGVQAIGTTIQTTFSSRITGGVGCQYGDQVGTVDGFGATIYSYPNQGSAGWTTTTGGKSIVNTNFFMNDYSKYGLETSTTGVLNPTFTCEKDENHPDSTTKAFGVEVTVQHFLLELDGYFYANVSGLYTFRLLAVDDLAAIWFGSGLSCCNSDVPEDSESPSFWASWDRTSNENGAAVANLYLNAGIYYPIKVRFANTNRAGALAFEVVDPSGNTINDFKGSVYRFVNIENRCTTVSATFPFSTLTVSDQEDSTFAVPTTTTDSAGDTVSTTVVIVEVSTTTKQTNTPTSTSFNNMLATVSTSETTSSEVLSTITEDPDIPETITTTKLTTFTNSDGSVETTRIVVIEVPGTTTTPANLTSTGVPQNTSSISTSEFVNNTQTSTEVPQNTSSILTSEFVNNTQTSLFVNTTSYWSVPLTTSTSNTSDSTSSYSPFTITSSSEVLSTITEDPDIPETITTTKLTTFTNSDGSVETTRIVVIEVPGTTTTPANLTSTGVPQNTSSISTSEFVNNTQTSTEVPQNTSSILTSEFVNNTQTSILMSTSSSWESSISSSSIMFWNSSIAITSSTTVLVSSTSSEVLSTITEDPDIPETITTTKLTTFTNWDGSVETTRIVVVEVPGTTTVSESTSEEESSTSATTSLTNGITSTQNTSFTSSQTTESTSDASSTKSDNIVSVSATPAISSESVLVSTTSNLGSSVATSSISKSSPVSTSSLTGSSTSSSSEVLSTITEDPDIPEVMTTTKLTTFTNSDGSVKTTRIVVVEVPGSTTSSTSSIETKSFISSVVTGNNTATAWRSLSTSQLESFSNTSAATSFEQSNKGPSFTETSSSIQSSSNTASALKTLVTNTINNVSSLSSETGKAEFSNTIDVSNTEATFGGASATTKSPYSSAKITSSPTQHHSTYPSTTITISQQSAESYAGNTPQISIYRGGAAESSNLNKFYFAFALIALLPFA